MGNIDTRSLWLFGYKGTILEQKPMLIDSYFKYMMNKTITDLTWYYSGAQSCTRQLEVYFVKSFIIFSQREET